ncbi:MAG: LPXTG cell wall anchor domain-containing protein [Clostridia bacterium]|nr:LPXTG cell wall anchor domain-containing protein [Clostridia bacterium]
MINYKVPKTGDNANLLLWLGCVLLGLTTISAVAYTGKRRKTHR